MAGQLLAALAETTIHASANGRAAVRDHGELIESVDIAIIWQRNFDRY
jgi:hypothetical protein